MGLVNREPVPGTDITRMKITCKVRSFQCLASSDAVVVALVTMALCTKVSSPHPACSASPLHDMWSGLAGGLTPPWGFLQIRGRKDAAVRPKMGVSSLEKPPLGTSLPH